MPGSRSDDETNITQTLIKRFKRWLTREKYYKVVGIPSILSLLFWASPFLVKMFFGSAAQEKYGFLLFPHGFFFIGLIGVIGLIRKEYRHDWRVYQGKRSIIHNIVICVVGFSSWFLTMIVAYFL